MKPPCVTLHVAGCLVTTMRTIAKTGMNSTHKTSPQPHLRADHPQPLTLLYLTGIQITDLNIQTIVIAGCHFKAV